METSLPNHAKGEIQSLPNQVVEESKELEGYTGTEDIFPIPHDSLSPSSKEVLRESSLKRENSSKENLYHPSVSLSILKWKNALRRSEKSLSSSPRSLEEGGEGVLSCIPERTPSHTSEKTLSNLSRKIFDKKRGIFPVFSEYLFTKFSKKKNILILGIGILISVVFMILTWNRGTAIENIVNIFPNVISLIYIFISAFKPKDDKQEILEETQRMLDEAKEEKKKSDEKINILVECLNELKYLGHSDFKEFMNKIASEGKTNALGDVSMEEAKDMLAKQKTLIREFSRVAQENLAMFPDDDLSESKNTISKLLERREMMGDAKISKATKSEIVDILKESVEIIKTYESERIAIKDFNFYSDVLESSKRTDLKSFKSMKLRKNFSYYASSKVYTPSSKGIKEIDFT